MRIHSPVLTWTPVFGSESRAEGPPSCQYNRSRGRKKARDVSDGIQRITELRTSVLDLQPLVSGEMLLTQSGSYNLVSNSRFLLLSCVISKPRDLRCSSFDVGLVVVLLLQQSCEPCPPLCRCAAHSP